MDSRIAADATAREVLEKLAVLERAAGVRAHYRLLEPPPLAGTDTNSLQTAARMIGDWIGLRNAFFRIVVGESATSSTSGIRLERDQEEFTIDLPRSSVVTPARAMGALAREVARAYLHKTNIRGGAYAAVAQEPIFVDVTTVFLGLGKLLLNACAGDAAPKASKPGEDAKGKAAGGCVLAPTYIAFAHRATCAMRGLDYQQHVTGLTPQSLELLRAWDAHHDELFSLSLRNVLTANAPHRPLMEAIADNQVVLSRFDQLLRHFEITVLAPLMQELASYHRQCQEAAERVTAREAETYDPCMVYLNQVRRRMDLQRLADSLAQQQEQVLARLQVIVRGLETLQKQQLMHPEILEKGRFPQALCPLDGTPVQLPEDARETKVKCPTCNYEFIASAEPPVVGKMPKAETTAQAAESGGEAQAGKRVSPKIPTALRDQKIATGGAGSALNKVVSGLAVLALSWVPLLVYVLFAVYRNTEPVHATALGRLGLIGSAIGFLLLLWGLFSFLTGGAKKPAAPVEAPPSVAPEKPAAS